MKSYGDLKNDWEYGWFGVDCEGLWMRGYVLCSWDRRGRYSPYIGEADAPAGNWHDLILNRLQQANYQSCIPICVIWPT